MRSFPDLNLRTYVRDRITGTPGFYCFSRRFQQPAGGGGGPPVYHLPYSLAEMRLEQRSEREFAFYSRRRFSRSQVIFKARYRGLGPTRKTAGEPPRLASSISFPSGPACFRTNRAGQPIRANLHHVPWPLEEAEAEIERNDLAAAVGLDLPDLEPVLHYSRRLAVYIWPAELVRPALAARPVHGGRNAFG